MNAATLFTGIGCAELAMPDWNWVWHAEIDPFASAVMAARHPKSVNLGDVTADDFAERALALCPRLDIIVFGSPCQGFSIAGKRLGMDDPRGNLTLVALRVLRALKPTWFTFENVPALLSSFSGSESAVRSLRGLPIGTSVDCVEDGDFATFLRAVSELGHSLCWAELDAQYAGLAQRRDRLFAVGHSGADWRYPAAILFESEGMCGHPPTRGEARKDVAGTLGSRTSAGGGLGTDFDLDGGLVSRTLLGKGDSSHAEDAETYVIARALTAKGGTGRIDGESETFIAHTLKGEGFDASEDGSARGTPLVAVPIAFTVKGSGNDAGEISPTQRSGNFKHSHASGGVMPGVAYWFARSAGDTNLGFDEELAPPQTTRHGDPGNVLQVGFQSSRRHAGVITDGVRRLMPIECERLQGLPDDYTNITYRGKPAKDGPRYKAIGNGMAVPVMRWILSRIENFDRHALALVLDDEENRMFRASGECLCVCGREYWRHPVTLHRSFDEQPYLHKLCNGDIVKL